MKKINLYLILALLLNGFFAYSLTKEEKTPIILHEFQKHISKVCYIDKEHLIFVDNNDSYLYSFSNKTFNKLSFDINDKKIIKILPTKNIVSLNNGEIYLNNKNYTSLNNVKSISFQDNFFIVNSNDKFGVLDNKLKTIIPFEYDFIEKGESLFLVKKDNKIGYVDNQNNLIIPFEYDSGLPDKNNNFVALKDNKVGVIDLKNKTLIDFKYDNFIRFANKFIGFKDNKFYLLSENQTEELDGTWLGFPSNDSIFYEKNDKFGLLDSNGNKLTNNIFDELGQKNTNAIIFKKNNKYGLINQIGKEIYKNKADYIIPISQYFFIAGTDNQAQESIINSNGKTILKDNKFIDIFEINQNFLLAQTLTGFNIFNKNGVEIVSFDKINFFNDSIVFFQKNNQTYYIKFN